MKCSIPKGTRDFLPLEMARRNYIFDTIRDVFKTFCFASLSSSAVSSFLHNHTEVGRIGVAIPFHRWGTLSPKRGQTKSHPC